MNNLDIVDISLSVQKKRLMFTNRRSYFIKSLFDGISYILIFSVSFFFCIMAVLQSSYIIGAIMLTISAWIIGNFLFNSKLTEIKGKEDSLNREKIIAILNQRYKNLNLENKGQQLIQETANRTLFSSKKNITVVLNDNNLYINVQTMRLSSPSPFHGIINYIKCQSIKAVFTDSIKRDPL